MTKNYSLILIVLMGLPSCTSKELNLDDWLQYVSNEDSGLKKSRVWNSLKMQVEFRPLDFMRWQESGYQKVVDPAQWDKLGLKYDPYYYFLLSLSLNDSDVLTALGSQDSRYYRVLENLSYRMKRNCGVTTETDQAIDPIHAQFFRTYDSGTSSDILLVFDRNEFDDCSVFDFYLRDVGLNLPTQKFTFSMADINSIPKMKLIANK